MTEFSAEVAELLHAHGWREGRRSTQETAAAVRLVPYEPFPAAVAALEEFGGLYITQDGAGCELRRRPFALDPTLVPPSGQALADFARVLGSRLYPIGIEGGADALVVIDEQGRVFALDHAGEWYLGANLADAITVLVTGAQPPRVTDAGTW